MSSASSRKKRIHSPGTSNINGPNQPTAKLSKNALPVDYDDQDKEPYESRHRYISPRQVSIYAPNFQYGPNRKYPEDVVVEVDDDDDEKEDKNEGTSDSGKCCDSGTEGDDEHDEDKKKDEKTIKYIGLLQIVSEEEDTESFGKHKKN